MADWAFLRTLVEAQLRRHPDTAASWLFKLSVSLNSSTPAEFQNDLRSVPELLEGPVRAIAQLANLEVRYGEAERGMRRLYRMLRCNLDEPEALSAYFLSIVGAPGELPLLETELPAVVPGSCVALIDEFGETTRLVIDPADVAGLPKRDGYADAMASTPVALLGAVIGRQVDLLTLSFGDIRRYTVTSVQSAYWYMLQVVQERVNALGGLPHLKSVRIGHTGDADYDLAHMKAEVMRSADVSRQVFESYAAGHMALSGLSAHIGRSPVEAILGWPADGPPLFVGTGGEEERQVALERLARPDATYVIDALTLAELVHLEIQEFLAHLPKVLVSTVTRAMLEGSLSEAKEVRSVATSMEVNGQLAFIEHDARYQTRRIAFFTALLAAVDTYCGMQPAYGELGNELETLGLADVLQDEEIEVLLLARTANATVLTLDGRFRFFLEHIARIPGIWPQALLMHYANRDLVAPAKRACATVREFLWNRSFISLSAPDLIWMVLQGGAYLQQGMQRFKTYLSSDAAEFSSTVRIAFEFLTQIASLQTQFGAFGELFEHVVEAAMRHKQCPANFKHFVADFIVDLTGSANNSTHPCTPANALLTQRMQIQRRLLAERFIRAQTRLQAPPDTRPVAVRTIFCSAVPVLVVEESGAAKDAAQTRLSHEADAPYRDMTSGAGGVSAMPGQIENTV